MKTKTNKGSSKERMNKKLKKDELGFINKNTKKQIDLLIDDTFLLLELELAEIFQLDANKVEKIINEHSVREPLTIANVMNDMEKVLETDKELVRA